MKRAAALLLVAAAVASTTTSCGGDNRQEAVVSPTSTQPAPASTVAEVPTIVVPDFVGQTSEYARGVLDVLGLTVYVEESTNVNGEPDLIASQLPPAGTAVTPGSLVMVTVPAPQIRKPTLGLSAAAEQLLSETENLKAGHAATIRAASVLEQDPDITHNPFAVIVKFEDGRTDDEIAASLTAIGGTRIGKPLGFDNLFLVETLANPAEAVVSLRSETAVEESGLDYVVRTTDITNDPEVGKQWGLTPAPGLDISDAWAIATGAAEVVVAVIDSGIQLDHPDLASNIWVNPGEIADNNVDDDNNGYIDDVHGWDFWNWDNNPDDDDETGHGTHVAGTIGAVINNGVGVSGIAPNVRLMALKVFNANGSAYSNDIYRALEYAITNGAQISNNSYGSYGENPKMGTLIAAAARVGHVFVSAAGNDENNNDISPAFPASYPTNSIISVGATDQSGQMASFSNYGRDSVDVAAPGRDILSTTNNSGYGWMSGTSMAAPHVTGLVALMRSIEPNLTSSAIREILIETSRPDVRLQNLVVSNGWVDAAAAVSAITQGLIPTTTTAPPATTTQAPTTTAPPATTTQAPTTTAPPATTTTSSPADRAASPIPTAQIVFDRFVRGGSEIFVMDADGTNVRQLTGIDRWVGDPPNRWPIWSPDGEHIAYIKGDRAEDREIFVMEADGTNIRQLTDNDDYEADVSWSPDGEHIAFTSNQNGLWQIFVMDTDGTNVRQLIKQNASNLEPSWSPDGEYLAFRSGREIFVADADGTIIRQLTNNDYFDGDPAWSPDGKHIAFTSEGEVYGTHKIFVMEADGTNIRQVTGVYRPQGEFSWSPDSQHLVFGMYKPLFGVEISVISSDGTGLSPTGQQGENPNFGG